MTFRKGLGSTVISLGACLLASQVNAFALTDAGIRNLAGEIESSSAAHQGKGNAKVADINALTGLFAGDAWSFLDETNKSSTAFKDVSFILSADLKQTSGAWTLSSEGSDVSLYMDFALVMKGQGQWGAYLFESINVSSGDGEAGGNFHMPFINEHRKIAKLDHASIYGRLAKAPASPDSNAVPIPGSLALLAIGLVLGVRQLRQNSSEQAR